VEAVLRARASHFRQFELGQHDGDVRPIRLLYVFAERGRRGSRCRLRCSRCDRAGCFANSDPECDAGTNTDAHSNTIIDAESHPDDYAGTDSQPNSNPFTEHYANADAHANAEAATSPQILARNGWGATYWHLSIRHASGV
jgi:hypothetical protein